MEPFKLEILEKYANALAGIVGSWRTITFVDLMAGEGYYDSGEEGSTGRLAKISEAHSALGRRVRVIAFESNATAFARLEANTAGTRDLVDVRHGAWEENLNLLFEELRDDFVFFFLDPMGIREIPAAPVARITSRSNTEVLVNFNSVVASRLAGIAEKQINRSTAADARLRDVTGSDQWREGFAEARAARITPEHMARAYGRFVRQVGSMGTCLTVINERGVAGRPKYHLIFGSRHEKAFFVMNDILHAQRERLLMEASRARVLPLFGCQSEEDYDREREAVLVRSLAESLAAEPALVGQVLTVEELFMRSYAGRFADFKQAHYARAATLLLEEGRVRAVSEPRTRSGQLLRSVVLEFAASS